MPVHCPEPYSIQRLRGGLAIVWHEPGVGRRRHSLGTSDPERARAVAADFWTRRTARTPNGPLTIGRAMEGYMADRKDEIRSADRQQIAWERLKPMFQTLLPPNITKDLCKSYCESRRRDHLARTGRKLSAGTLHYELAHLRSGLLWAVRKDWLAKAPEVWLPRKPPPRDRWVTREQFQQLLDACESPHLALFFTLGITTAARKSAILQLTWNRVDFSRRQIDLNDPDVAETNKRRSIVPMNDRALAALVEAKRGALTEYVIEYGGAAVADVKKGVRLTAERAGLRWVTPHVLRHSAAVWMAQARVPIEEIAKYLGHADVKVTFRVYAKYHPDYLQNAAAALTW